MLELISDSQSSVGLLSRLQSVPKRRRQVLVLGGGLVVVVGIAAFSALRADVTDVEYWRTLGYPGVLLFSLIGSGAMVLPIPGLVAVCGASGIELNPVVVGLLSGIGEAVGELSGYAIGFGSRGAVERRPLYHTVRRWMRRRGTLVLFLVSVVPNPIFDVVGLAAGGTHFPLRRFLVTVWLGKTLKGLVVAYACFYGVKLLPWVG